MHSTTEKKNFFYIVILILTILVVVVGITIAAYYFLRRQEEGASKVYTGTLIIDYLAGDIIDCDLLVPSSDPDFDDRQNLYRNNFKVKNTGTLDSVIKVKVDINKNEFSNDIILYKFFNDEGVEINNGVISGTGEFTVANNVILESQKEVEYTLVIWLKETGENQNEEMKKNLTGKITVDANQKIN